MATDRRNFLKMMGLAGAGAGLLPLQTVSASSSTPRTNERISSTNNKNEFKVKILQTTDVHCQIHPHDELFWENDKAVFRKTGGYAYLSSYLKNEKAKAPEQTFIIDTGDMFQGSELSVKTLGKAMVPILNGMNYDLYLPGNWEVVYYKKAMQQLLGHLNAPKVCANMYHDLGDGKKGESIFNPYYIWNINGVKIGFLGYTDHLVPKRQSPNYSKGIIYTKPEENLAHYVSVLREDEGCEYVIIIAHLGLSQQINLANLPECEGVDYILGGDTHERVRKPIQCKYAKVVEPGAFGSFVGELTLTIKDGKVVNDSYELVEVSTNNIEPDKEVEKIIKENEAPFAEDIHKVIGYSAVPLYRYFVVENPIDTLVIDAISWKLKDVDVILSNGFRFCPPNTTPDKTGNIPITNGYLFDMIPVDGQIRTAEVTGKQLREWLEKELNNVFSKDASKRFGGWVVKFAGMDLKFKAFAEMGERVQSVKIGGKALEENKVYKISACERDGDPDDVLCRIKGVKNAKNAPYTIHGAIKEYLAKHSPVKPIPPKRAVALDAPETLLTQVTGVDYEFR